jgi:hypothetical protein
MGAFMTLGGCDAPCRSVEHRPLELICDTEDAFASLHLDSTALFEAFLRKDCHPQQEIETLVSRVDFSNEVVFCASGPLNDPDVGCLRNRSVRDVESCTDGVQFLFDDTYQPEAATLCSNQLWIFCEVVNRNEIRNSLTGDSISETIAF